MGEGAFKMVGSYADPVVPNIGSYLGSGRLGVTKNDGSVTDPVFLTFLSNTSSLSLSLDGENLNLGSYDAVTSLGLENKGTLGSLGLGVLE